LDNKKGNGKKVLHVAASKIIKQLLIERGKSVKQLAELFGISGQSMSNKLYRDNFSFEDVLKIADYLNCDVKIVTRDTKKEF
jgi:DNA-binding Xre family transcriptional regulator